jgi:putative intracellular protease/amidase
MRMKTDYEWLMIHARDAVDQALAIVPTYGEHNRWMQDALTELAKEYAAEADALIWPGGHWGHGAMGPFVG